MPYQSGQTTLSVPQKIFAYGLMGLFCGAGPFILLLTLVTGLQRAWFIHTSLETDGVILGVQPVRPNRPTSRSMYPVFRFTTKDGQVIIVQSHNAQQKTQKEFGHDVRVFYQADDPQNAVMDTPVQLWMPQMVMGAVGAGFSLLPLAIWLKRRRGNG